MHPFAGNGMQHREASGKKSHLFVRHGSGCAVAEIAHHGKPDIPELSADLVVTAGFKIDCHEAFSIPLVQQPVGKPRFPASRLFPGNDPAGSVFYPDHLVDQGAAGPVQVALKHCQVLLFNRFLPELGADARGRLGGSAEQDNACHRPVQAVDHGQKHPARLVVALLDPLFRQFKQTLIPGLISLHKEPRWLIKTKKVVVLVEDGPAGRKKTRQPIIHCMIVSQTAAGAQLPDQHDPVPQFYIC